MESKAVATHMIMCVATAFDSMHDLTLLRHSGVRLHPETALIGDAGYLNWIEFGGG